MLSVKKNIVWNLLGNILPLLAGLIFFPIIVDAYGLERFGLLTLAWALVGYFSLFDLGLSRALTQQVSVLIAKKQAAADIAVLIRTALKIMLGLGLLGALFLWFFSPFLVVSLLKISNKLQSDAITSFLILSLSIPMVVHTSALRGILESLNMFKEISLIRMVMGVGTFVGPYLASLISDSLVDAIYALIILRIFVWILHYVMILKSGVLNPQTSGFDASWLGGLFKFGGWLTLSNVIGPLMVYLDRFVIVSMLGAAAVSYYVAPYEVITKLWVIPAAITGVLFPLFARYSNTESFRMIETLDRGVKYILILLFPLCLFLVYFSIDWLGFWLEGDFSLKSTGVVTWLVSGILINSAAQIIYTKIQGVGRSDLTAKLHLIELIPYIIMLWLFLTNYGIVGAALAWFFRVAFDFFGLIYIVRKLHPDFSLKLREIAIYTTASTLLVIFVGSLQAFSIGFLLFVACIIIYLLLTIVQIKSDGIIVVIKNYLNQKNG